MYLRSTLQSKLVADRGLWVQFRHVGEAARYDGMPGGARQR